MTDGGGKKIGLNFETVGSIVAMIIGACALFVAWDQAQIMRKQQHASVLPVLNVSAGLMTNSSGHKLTVSVRNGGIGPAVINSAQMTVAGKQVVEWRDFAAGLLPEPLREGYETSFDSAIGILAAGESTNIIQISWARSQQNDIAVQMLRDRIFSAKSDELDFSICYCSVFEHCWLTNAQDTARPVPVKSCSASGDDVVARLLRSVSRENAQ